MLTVSRGWIKGWLRTITVEQSVETVLPMTERQTVPLPYHWRDFDLTGVISIFMNSRLYYSNSLLLHIELWSFKWKWIQNITSFQKHSLQQIIPHPLHPILFSAATLIPLRNWKSLFSFPVLPRGVDNLPKGWLHNLSLGSPITAPSQEAGLCSSTAQENGHISSVANSNPQRLLILMYFKYRIDLGHPRPSVETTLLIAKHTSPPIQSDPNKNSVISHVYMSFYWSMQCVSVCTALMYSVASFSNLFGPLAVCFSLYTYLLLFHFS